MSLAHTQENKANITGDVTKVGIRRRRCTKVFACGFLVSDERRKPIKRESKDMNPT